MDYKTEALSISLGYMLKHHKEFTKGGQGSGNWGHSGRPGKRGGSATVLTQDMFKDEEHQSTEEVREKAAEGIADNWNPSDEGLDAALEEEGMDKTKSKKEKKTALAEAWLHQWEGGSGGAESTVIAEHFKKKWNLPDSAVTHMSNEVAEWMNSNPEVKETMVGFGEAMYKNTQDWFAERNITHVKAMRAGFETDTGRVLTSWSADWGGMRHEPDRVNYEKTFPVEQVLSVPATGYGTLAESELVVIDALDSNERSAENSLSSKDG